jgi:threonylcarbamoyladenosine tRNA methylthiotransferase MtaB
MTGILRTCRFVTLGCKVNQYESQYVKETLEANGYREAADDEAADLCVVNTCTVTMEGDAKSRQTIRRLHQRNPGTRIIVMGCYATRDPDAVRQLPGVVKVITDKTRLPEELSEFDVHRWPRGIRRFDGHQRAFVKVQDGCLLHCAFCIIPSVRPRLISRPIADVVAEVSGLVASGVQEIVLTGVHLGHYGLDLGRGESRGRAARLWHLIEALDALPGDFRIRLSSLEAAEARTDLVRALSQARRVAPHLHLCLQSGSDRILSRMKRRYRAGHFLDRCLRIKETLDAPAFTTDVIVGFPGETDADFEDTCRVVRAVGFSKIHVFSYSPRQGTPAATLDGQTPAHVIDARREHLRQLERELARRYYESLLGRTLGVLVEGEDPHRPGRAMGTSCRYAPVSFVGYVPALLSRIVDIAVIRLEGDVLVGEPVPGFGDNRMSLHRKIAGRLNLPVV